MDKIQGRDILLAFAFFWLCLVALTDANFDAAIAADTTLTRVCSSSSDSEYCNPNWVPFPNMDQALLGYDYASSDPFADGGDPAFRSKIFNAVEMDKDGRFSMDAGITAIDMLECTSNEESQTVSNFKEYKGMQASSFSLGIEAGYEGAFASVSASVKMSMSQKKEQAFFSSGEGMMLISEARCLTHKVTLNNVVPPKFSDGFISSLRQLEAVTPDQKSLQESLFTEFYTEWGTHYISDARFGAKLVVKRRFSKSKVSSEEMSKAKFSMGVSVGFDVMGGAVKGNVDANLDTKSTTSSKSGNKNKSDSTQIIAIGSKPQKDGEEWAGQDFDSPQIISMSLQPIQSLFKEDILKRYNINAAKIKAWFDPKMNEFCTAVNKKLPPSEQLQCTQKSGCGIDDNCSLDEICIPKLGSAYYCEISAAAKLKGPKVVVSLQLESSAAEQLIDLSSATCTASSEYSAIHACGKALVAGSPSWAVKADPIGSWIEINLPGGKMEYVSKIYVKNRPHAVALNKELKIAFLPTSVEKRMLLADSAGSSNTLSLQTPISSNKIRIDVLSIWRGHTNGFNYVKVYKMGSGDTPLSLSSATCTASSEQTSDTKCDKALIVGGGDWATKAEGSGSWIEINLPGGTKEYVSRLEAASRANLPVKELKITFQDTLERTLNMPQSTSPGRLTLETPIFCNKIKILVVSLYNKDHSHIGFQYVKLFKRDSSNMVPKVFASDLSAYKTCNSIAQLPTSASPPFSMLRNSPAIPSQLTILAKDTLYEYQPTTNSWQSFKVATAATKAKMEGSYHMFKLSDGRIWFLSKDTAWKGKQGSFIYKNGVLWPGFTSPTKSEDFSGFSIVQLDTRENKDKFFISGGIIGTGPSTKGFMFDTNSLKDAKVVPTMPVHLSEHTSSIVRAARHGTEIMLILGKSGSQPNTKSYFFNIAKGSWRTGDGVPTESNSMKTPFKNELLVPVGNTVALHGGVSLTSIKQSFLFHAELGQWAVTDTLQTPGKNFAVAVTSVASLPICK